MDFKQEFYKRTYLYAVEVVGFVSRLPKDSASHILGQQLIRSGTSIAANLVEAKAASSKKDYINFYQHALKSANETKLWLGLLRDTNRVNNLEADKLLKETSELANILASSIITMKGKNKI